MVDKTIMKRPIHYVIEADIKGFFDNVSHDWMLRCLEVRIQDPSLLLLIRRFLKAGYVEAGQLVSTEQGTPQGGNLSPIIANILSRIGLNPATGDRVKTSQCSFSFRTRSVLALQVNLW